MTGLVFSYSGAVRPSTRLNNLNWCHLLSDIFCLLNLYFVRCLIFKVFGNECSNKLNKNFFLSSSFHLTATPILSYSFNFVKRVLPCHRYRDELLCIVE